MMTYDTYKDSGIDWLGGVPEHWNNYRVDFIASIVRGNTGFKKDELLDKGEYVALQYGKTYKVDSADNSFNFFVNREFYKKSQTVNNGDTILISTSETIEDLGHTCHYQRHEVGLLGGEQILLKPHRKILNAKYLYYYSRKFCAELRKDATGLKVFRFNTDNLKQITLAIPPLPEQKAIAEYLDSKTKGIDNKVSLLQKKIVYYKELRKSLINDAVTKGLDKTVELKESGIEWIGKIPEHWEVKRFKSFGKTIKGKNLEVFDKRFENSLPNLSLDYLRNDKATFPAYCYTHNKSLNANENDILIVWDGAAVGEMIKAKEGFISSTIAKFEFDKSYSSRFFKYLGNQIHYTLKSIPTGMGIPHLNPTILNNFMCPAPPIEEQNQIAEYLDQKTTSIDKMVENISHQVDRLKELRKTLINNVVTGKIKVV